MSIAPPTTAALQGPAMSTRILALVGSLRAGSYNRPLAQAAIKLAPGEGDYVALPGFGAVFKLSSKTNGGEVSIVEHPFEVGLITAAHRHTREDEHSIVLARRDRFPLRRQ